MSLITVELRYVDQVGTTGEKVCVWLKEVTIHEPAINDVLYIEGVAFVVGVRCQNNRTAQMSAYVLPPEWRPSFNKADEYTQALEKAGWLRSPGICTQDLNMLRRCNM